jgi:glycosyltransferase involved in cell wall biosynthesis
MTLDYGQNMQLSDLLIDELKKLDSKVIIFIPRTENFGVRFFCEELQRFLVSNGIEAELQSFKIFDYIKKYKYYKKYIMILSLNQLILSLFFPNNSIAILHGFPNPKDYSFLKYKIVSLVTYVTTKYCLFTIANSSLTKDINEKFFGITTNFIWNPLIGDVQDVYLDRVHQNFNNKPSLIFVGRISKAKGFDIVTDYIKANSEKYSSINIIGPDPNDMTIQLSKIQNVNIYGVLKHNDVLELLGKHDIFVSLNFLEPFGMVYLEALDAGCIIISPYHAGFSEHVDSPKVVTISDTSTYGIKAAFGKAIELYYNFEGVSSHVE